MAKQEMKRKPKSERPKSRRLLFFESLEHRLAMDGSAVSAAASLPWFELGALTYSFAIDGTQLGDSQSKLYSVFDQVADSKQWQSTIDKSFSDWLDPLGAHIRKMTDLGSPFGSFGPTQGDSRFGDVRIGAVPLSNNVLAESIPHSMLVQGSLAGDILLNSNASWTSLDQIYSVMLHEFGHVLGLRHNNDPNSAMYSGGIHPGQGPSKVDIQLLKKTYSGVNLEDDDDRSDLGSGSPGQWNESPKFSFDPKTAVSLQAALASSARYTASGELTPQVSTALYKLLPLGEIDDAEYLNIVVSAKDQNGLIPSVTVYDEDGDKLKLNVMHNSAGVLAIQAKDAKPKRSYFVAISSASAPAKNQVGRFGFFAEYGNVAMADTKVGTFNIGADKPIAEYSLNLETTRLIHWMITATTSSKQSQSIAEWGTLVDSKNHILSQIAIRPGDTRSAPLVLLAPGSYRILLQTGLQNSRIAPVIKTTLFVDEISVDVGAGVIDPTLDPMLGCDTPGSNPSTCLGNPLVVIHGPIFPNPISILNTPDYPSIPPWTSPTWYYWPTILSGFGFHNSRMALDVTGDTQISPLDVLAVINSLNRVQGDVLPAADSAIFPDTNGDGFISPLDALLVINYLNAQGTADGEGTGPSLQTDLVNTFFWYFDTTFGARGMSQRISKT